MHKSDANFCLYVHVVPNGKLYFGITSRVVEKRWGSKGNQYGKDTLFGRAIKKYGWDNIKHIILFENLDQEVACECEKYLIAKYETYKRDRGYNIQLGGWSGNLGLHESEETRKKIGDKNKGRRWSEEQKKSVSMKLKGVPHTKEHNQNVSKALKGKYVGELSSAYGLKRSEETRRLMSESAKRGWEKRRLRLNGNQQCCV